MIILLSGVIIFLGIFTQSLVGFGSALICMPLLIQVLGVRPAATLFALVVCTAELMMVVRYRRAFSPRAVSRLVIASLVGIPVGVYLLSRAPETLVLLLLGLLLISYGLYALSGFKVPPLQDSRWGYGFGFVSGMLSGAYNTGGPPLVIYATGRRWSPAEFKSNVQTIFVFNTFFVLATRATSGDITPEVSLLFVLVMPFALLALAAGFYLERYVNPQLFRRIVLVLLVILGVKMILFDSGIF